MQKLMYADDLMDGDRFKYQDLPEMTCEGGTRPEIAECDGCRCQTIKKLRINVPGGAMTIPNDPKAVVTLLHRPHEHTEQRDAFHESVKHACLAVVDAGFTGKGREKAISKAHAALEAYLLAFHPEKA